MQNNSNAETGRSGIWSFKTISLIVVVVAIGLFGVLTRGLERFFQTL